MLIEVLKEHNERIKSLVGQEYAQGTLQRGYVSTGKQIRANKGPVDFTMIVPRKSRLLYAVSTYQLKSSDKFLIRIQLLNPFVKKAGAYLNRTSTLV